MRGKYQTEIEKRIESFDPRYAFSAIDFSDMAGTDPINKALSRLCEAGTIRRVLKGIYDKPSCSEFLGEYFPPNIEKVVEAIARKYNWTVAPSWEIALNKMHLSTLLLIFLWNKYKVNWNNKESEIQWNQETKKFVFGLFRLGGSNDSWNE